MPTPLKNMDKSTINEYTLKAWADCYPPEDIDILKQKAQSLDLAIKNAKDNLTQLQVAKSKLANLTNALPPVLTKLQTANHYRNEFIAAYGTLGISSSPSHDEMDTTIRQFTDSLASYASQVEERFFANLSQVESTISFLSALKDLYLTLATIPDIINNSFFKTEESRRKPIIRELYRLFSNIASNYLFSGTNPSSHTSSLISPSLSQDEFNSLLKVKEQANKTLSLLRSCR